MRYLIAIAFLAFAAPAQAGGNYLEPNVTFGCQISPDTSKSFVDRMFTGCSWGAGLTLKKKEEYNHYSYDNSFNPTINNPGTVNIY